MRIDELPPGWRVRLTKQPVDEQGTRLRPSGRRRRLLVLAAAVLVVVVGAGLSLWHRA